MRCLECYSDQPRVTPLLGAAECLRNHTQYICSTCGRYVCIEGEETGRYRWKYPFKDCDTALLYLKTAEIVSGRNCGIYELQAEAGRTFAKIFPTKQDLLAYLQDNPGTTCPSAKPVYLFKHYFPVEVSQIRKLTEDEVQRYLAEQEALLARIKKRA